MYLIASDEEAATDNQASGEQKLNKQAFADNKTLFDELTQIES
ncbi:hypothetical protein [Thalassotalea eurytherma]|nr:hypothetical protein [Thalassotalea eurytherma]